ncbi:MAG: DUF2288 domain-containing protein [Pseudomonadota bacterium]
MIDDGNLERAKLNLETAIIPWRELLRHFAAGRVVQVASELDLVEVATQFMRDNKSAVEHWLQQSLVNKVSDAQAEQWHNADAQLWAVVVSPWVLVQMRVA